MPNHNHIYKYEVRQYDRLISREDCNQNLIKVIRDIAPELERLDLLDMGTGTGKLACITAPYARSLIATDASAEMLEVAAEKLKSLGLSNYETRIGDNHNLPLPDRCVDLITAGWTICYSASTNIKSWRANLKCIMAEIERVLRPSGTIILFENFGTGSASPHPPDFLTGYYDLLEQEYGFSHRWIRTDFQFQTLLEADELLRFFFGDELAVQASSQGSTLVPGCTGVWWKQL